MSAPHYELIAEHTDLTNPDSVSMAPQWVLAVVRLSLPLTFSRKNMGSVEGLPGDGVKARGKTLVITSGCKQLVIQSTKSSHLDQLSAVLLPGEVEYLSAILPGDWVLAWIVQGEERRDELVQRIKNGRKCNAWRDGLKFVGRALSPRKRIQQSPEGPRHKTYLLQAVAFSELDSQFYYDPNLANSDDGDIGTWLCKLNTDVRDIFAATAEGNLEDNVGKIIPSFFEVFLGRGVSKAMNPTGEKQLQVATGAGATAGAGLQAAFAAGLDEASVVAGDSKEAPFAYLVPKEVGALLGKESRDASKAGGALAYADLMELQVGVQKYTNQASSSDPYKAFVPELDDDRSTPNRRYTKEPLSGAYLPFFPSFTNRPLWSVFMEFLNPTMNELFTALRVNPDGDVVPTLVARQIPLTTEAMKAKLTGGSDVFGTAGDQAPPAFTAFLDLPRWVIHPVLVKDVDLGRSNATRCNFVAVDGVASYSSSNVTVTEQRVLNPPIRDDLDIQRSGLHPYMATVACGITDQVGHVPRKWMELIADYSMGSHLTLTGTIEVKGVGLPICKGDNIQLYDGVYHLEGFIHVCSEDAGGRKSFNTSLVVSNGMRSDGTKAPPKTSDDDEFPMYLGVDPNDTSAMDPGYSVEQPDTPGEDDVAVTPPNQDEGH